MKKISTMIMVLICVIVLAGCGNNSSFSTTDKAFYIDVPDDFTKKVESKEDVFFFQNLQDDEDKFKETLRIIVEEGKENLELKEFYELDAKDYASFLADYKEEKIETVKFKGKDAYRIEFQASISDKQVEDTRFDFIKYIVKHNDDFYVIVFQTEVGKKDDYKETLKTILDTVEFK